MTDSDDESAVVEPPGSGRTRQFHDQAKPLAPSTEGLSKHNGMASNTGKRTSSVSKTSSLQKIPTSRAFIVQEPSRATLMPSSQDSRLENTPRLASRKLSKSRDDVKPLAANDVEPFAPKDVEPFTAVFANHQTNTPMLGSVTVADPRSAVPQTKFESTLTNLAKQFAFIDSSAYTECYSFVKNHPDILEENYIIFLNDALAALAAGQKGHANRCVLRAVMIQQCKDSSTTDVKKFFEGLINKKRAALSDFLKNRDDAMARLEAKVPAQAAAISHPALSSGTADASIGPAAAQGSYNTSSLSPTHSGYSDVLLEPTNMAYTDLTTWRESTNTNIAATAGNFSRRVVSGGPTVTGPDGSTVETLDSRYRVRGGSDKFFTFGRVFATPWHTTLGATRASRPGSGWTVQDRFGENILTHIQRMVVVKEGHGFCRCVPISTYSGQGVAKTGLSDEDRFAHTVVYMEGSEVKISKEEEKMMAKKSIAVRPAAPDQKLHVMSRINFQKVHTIEHNVKVMDVGKISRDTVEDFRQYWNEYR